MRRLLLTIIVVTLTFMCGYSANAEIYAWTDARGVKHYSNSPPPVDAQDVERRAEKAHDAESHQRRLEQERASFLVYQEAEARRLEEEMKLELLRRHQEASEEAAAAARRAEIAAQKAADAAESTRNRSLGYIIVPNRRWYSRPWHETPPKSRSWSAIPQPRRSYNGRHPPAPSPKIRFLND